MLNKLIYELTKVRVYDYVDENEIRCRSIRFGYFDTVIAAEDFIRKHNHDENCFFIMRTFVFNPSHYGQTSDYLTERTYDAHAEMLCDCKTHHFVVNFNELYGRQATVFTGRDDCVLHKRDVAWFYDGHDDVLRRCEICETPFDTEQAKNYDCLEYRDDSYIVYPLPIPDEDNHQHIISCYVFTVEQVKKMTDV